MASVVETKQRGRAVDLILILVHIMDLIRYHRRIYEHRSDTLDNSSIFFVTVRDRKKCGLICVFLVFAGGGGGCNNVVFVEAE